MRIITKFLIHKKMGRHYSGDIDGKFWFGVQDSNDADFFGCEGEPMYWENDEEDEGGNDEPYALYYSFDTDHLDDINEGINRCLEVLGDYKGKFDDFFNSNETYTDEILSEKTGCGMDQVKTLLENYARLGLGEKIKKCVEETGMCSFDADLS